MTASPTVPGFAPVGAGALCRIGPNEDLVAAIEKAADEAGFDTAFIRGALGSLYEVTFDVNGNRRTLKGPAIEILSLNGRSMRTSDGGRTTDIYALVGDVCGMSHGGQVVAGTAPVCVTVELMIETMGPATGPATGV